MDSLKLLACIGVFWSHFARVYILRSEVGALEINGGVTAFINLASAFLNGDFWVCVFCIVSGYLACRKKIENIKELLISLWIRYLRFVFPFVAMALFVCFLSVTAGFPTAEYEEILQCGALANSYKTAISVKTLLQSVFLFHSVLNAPMWMMQPLFLGNCFLYCYQYATRKTNKRLKMAAMAFVFLLCMVAGRKVRNLLYVACCFLGYFLGQKEYLGKNTKIKTVILLGLLVLLSGGQDGILKIAANVMPIPSILYLGTYWHILYAFCMLELVYQTQAFQKVLEWSGFRKLSNLSFAIYMIHWPLICSVSLLLYGWLCGIFSYTVTFFFNFIITNALVFAIAKIYTMTWEKWSFHAIGKIRAKFLA
ncbi:MAG: acyltransferase family protein [Lachnoclostridium sp.]|nr:acyltransferase family protein [Lachnoclostridium sp.]